MAQFSQFPAMPSASSQNSRPEATLTPIMYCGGCASKVGSNILEHALRRIQAEQHFESRDDILVGLETPDDAAVVLVPAGQAMVHTVDFFRAILDDPFIFGQICANHCLSDLYAMGATPQTALAIATLPYGLEPQQQETLYQLLSGAVKVLGQAQVPLVGGHTTEGAELIFGFACNGWVNPQHLLQKSGMQPGQVLILTKPLGTGALFAANMRGQAKGRWIEQAIQSMVMSNQGAAECFRCHGATACTDITGYGLLGHLMEMVKASGVGVQLDLAALPILDGVLEVVAQGIVSSLYAQNLKVAQAIHNQATVASQPRYPVLFDPQTSGGLLASLPVEQAESCLAALQHLGYRHSRLIGEVRPTIMGQPPLTIAL